MSLHMLSPSELLLAAKTHVAYINLQDNVVDKFTLPEEKPVKSEDEDCNILPPGVQNMTVSSDNQHVALSTRQKFLYVFKLTSRRPFELTAVAKINLSRVANKIRFSADYKQLLVADKTGDCFLWSYLEEGAVLQPVCGHLSMVMDVFFNDDQTAVITCDRDEKIRVTSYPDTHNLISYCMGHTEYVSKMELVPHNPQWLASISGDQTIRIWDYKTGVELFKLPLAGPGAYMTCWKSDIASSSIACHIYQSNILQIFEIQSNAAGDGLKMKSMKQVELPKYTRFKAIDHYTGGLMTLTMNNDEDKLVPRLDKLEYSSEERTYLPVDLSQINNILRQELSDLDTEDRDDVAVLFKKRVNNIVHYHERKRKRIEERSK